MNIPRDLYPILNPDNKRLTTKQWENAYNKYLVKEDKKEQEAKAQVEEVGERPGVCECGSGSFSSRVLVGSGGMFERTCVKCGNQKIT